MATEYVVSGRGDLDTLFAPRTLAAGSNVGFVAGGADLAQRFEQRAGATAIADTGFRAAGAADLAQIFLDIAATTSLTRTFVPATSSTRREYTSGQYGTTAVGTMSNNLFGAWRIVEATYDPGANCRFSVGNDAGPPPNADTVWQSMSITGVFQDSGGSSVTRTVNRSAASSSTAGTYYRTWAYGTAAFQLIAGNTYTMTHVRT